MKKKVRRKLWNRIFKEVFNSAHLNGVDLITTCKKIEKHHKAIQKLRDYHLSIERDYRSGYETYGYNNPREIENSLIYVSDRFGCAFRLTWLLNVPNEVNKLYNQYPLCHL
jgi:hypothetical protein